MGEVLWTGGLFRTWTLRGTTGAINWGYRPAATLRTWAVTRTRDAATGEVHWTLQATLAAPVGDDGFLLRQRPLLFNAPRRGGFWCFPVREVQVGPTTVIANLDHPEF